MPNEFVKGVEQFHQHIDAKQTGWESTSGYLQELGCKLKASATLLERGGLSDPASLRAHLMLEELGEYLTADNEVDAFDAIIDLLYVVIGTAVTHGWPLEEGFRRVQTSNMTKVPQADDPARVRVRQKGDAYVPPDLGGLL